MSIIDAPLALVPFVLFGLVMYVILKWFDDRHRRSQGLDVEPWPWERWRNEH